MLRCISGFLPRVLLCHNPLFLLLRTDIHPFQNPTAFLLGRHRSAEDDFQLAVQGLGVGTGDEGAPTGVAGGEETQQPLDAGVSVAEQKVGVEGDGSGESGESGATKEAASPPEHPLQKAITSFDMALGELNQLVHLVDLARAGEFMVLERVTPTEEDQARAMSDQSVRSTPALLPRLAAIPNGSK